MKEYRFVKAYMAGAVLPTLAMLGMITAVFVARFVLRVPVAFERAVIFPIAVVPALFGFWNMLYIGVRGGCPGWKIGALGALFPFVMAPIGGSFAHAMGFLEIARSGVRWLGQVEIPMAFLLSWFVFVVIAYYLIWKYVVGWLNRVVEIG